MRSAFTVAVERLDHEKAVARVDTDQLQEHEANRATFPGRTRFEPAPDFGIDRTQGVVDGRGLCHRGRIIPRIVNTDCTVVTADRLGYLWVID